MLFQRMGRVAMPEEHKKNVRPSSREKHEKGQTRKRKDACGEKGDKRRQKRKRPRSENEG